MSINLLPSEEKNVAADRQIIIRKVICGGLVSLATIVIINMFFGIILMSRNAQVTKLEKKYNIYQNLQKDIVDLRKNIDYLNREIALIEGFFSNNFSWSGKLLTLAKNIPQEIWLKRLAINNEKGIQVLKISGSVTNLETDEKPLSILNKFIERLKKDNAFSKDFEEIALIDIRSASIKTREILEFNMDLIVKK
ncbi:MAG: hypothetical protein WCY05_07150 [Candidatus Omnitrophota bacterium]